MPYEVRDADGYKVVVLNEEVDLSCSPEARKTILDALGDGGAVFVDLSAVTYIDSSGVASLVEGFQTAKTNGQRFALVGVSDAALAVLKLARLDQVFEISPTLEAALSGSA